MMDDISAQFSRKEFIKTAIRNILLFLISFSFINRLIKASKKNYVWQIDPEKCVKCGRCADTCVLKPSAVKCVHAFNLCGYCNLCFGYFQPGAKKLTQNAENELCPTGAIKRKFVEDPFFEYTVNEKLCIGCAKCVKGCDLFGNGSLYLQVKHDLCKNCNDCSIARNCAGKAFKRMPANKSYMKKVI